MPTKSESNTSDSTVPTRSEFRFKVWDRTLGSLTALSLIVGGSFTVIRYLGQRDEDLKIREREYKLAFIESGRDVLPDE